MDISEIEEREDIKQGSARASLTADEVSSVIAGIMGLSSVSYLDAILWNRTKALMEKHIKWHHVIEIWPWWNPLNSHLDIEDYVWVDLWQWDDGLTFLKKQPSKSAVIVSFWMFDKCIIHPSFDSTSMELWRKYMIELMEEIKRVSYPVTVMIWPSVEEFFWEPDMPFGSWWIYFLDKNNR